MGCSLVRVEVGFSTEELLSRWKVGTPTRLVGGLKRERATDVQNLAGAILIIVRNNRYIEEIKGLRYIGI